MSRNLSILFRYLSWFILFLLVCLIGKLQVFADTFENIGYLNNFTEVNVEVSYTGSPLPLTRTNTYQLQDVEALNIQISNYSFNGDKTYSIELYTPNTTLQYANAYTATGFGSNNTSYNCSVFDITYTDSHYPNFRFKCPSNINSIYIRVYNTNGNSIMPTGIFAWNYVYLRSVITEDNTQDIINNQNQNTQDIINNQNQNTQDIINNQNQLLNSCHTSPNLINKENDTIGYRLGGSGDLFADSPYLTTDYISVSPNTKYTYSRYNTGGPNSAIAFYDSNKSFISREFLNANNSSFSYTLGNNVSYIRIADYKTLKDTMQFEKGNGSSYEEFGEICQNKIDETNKSIKDLKDTLTDDSPLDVSSLGNTLGWLPAGPIDSIINLPLNLFNSLTTALGLTCSPLTIPLPYVNKNMTIPCLSTLMQQMGFSTFWNWVGTIASIVIMYRYLLNLYKYYDDLTTLKANFISDFGGAP